MSASGELKAVATLCKKGSHLALERLNAMGTRPVDPKQAAIWDKEDGTLQEQVTKLSSLARTLAAKSVTAAMEEIWPKLERLETITEKAEADIKRIEKLADQLAAIADIIALGAAVLSFVNAPGKDTAKGVLQTFNSGVGKMRA